MIVFQDGILKMMKNKKGVSMSKIKKLEAKIKEEKMTKLQKLEAELKKEKAKELYIVFMSPGSFMSESNSKKIKTKDIKTAVLMAKSIKQRYGASPYGFHYEDGNGKQKGPFYYITGTLRRYEEIPDTREFNILKSNMYCNEWPIVIENKNSYRVTRPFEEKDVIVDWDGNITIKGNDKELVEYRKRFIKNKEEKRREERRKEREVKCA